MATLKNPRQEMLNALALKRAEQQACFDFAVHLSRCVACRGGRGGAGNLCAAGLEARDKSITAARALAEVDPEFARKNSALIA